ncbi:MAG: efflux RND transporter periplasmic adaptor subunit [Cyanobacteriota bacterium]|nr:efflux RND transporter periplasmic adaptor subunit [Cyanobacteriota bacterium]
MNLLFDPGRVPMLKGALQRADSAKSVPESRSRSISHQITFFSTVLLACAIAAGCSRAPAGGPPQQSIPVQVEEIETSVIEESSEFVGTLEAAEKVDLRPRVEGRIEKILASNGDRVERGKLLAELQPTKDRAELRAATENINVQRANLNSVRAELNAAEAQQAQAEAGVQSARATLQSQNAEIQRQEAELALREEEFKRAQTLVAQGVQPRQTLDEKRRDFDVARADLISTRALRDSQAEALNAAIAAREEAEERVRASRAALDRETANVKQAEAEQESATQDFQFTRVTAPITGTIGDIPVKVGDVVNSSTILTTITQNNALELRLSIPAERSEQLREGLPVELLLDGDRAIEGNVSFISPQVDRNAQSILAKATFPNPDGALRDGQVVKARVIWSQETGIAIPTTAISRIGGQAFVFSVEPSEEGEEGAIAKQVPVTLGPLQGQSYPVLTGIKAGDEIVTEGVLKLQDGVPITREN